MILMGIDLSMLTTLHRFNHADLVELLNSAGDDRKALFAAAAAVKKECVGNKVFFRGLVEYSNICSKNCYAVVS